MRYQLMYLHRVFNRVYVATGSTLYGTPEEAEREGQRRDERLRLQLGGCELRYFACREDEVGLFFQETKMIEDV